MLAAGTGNVDTVDLLLKCGATESINTTDLVNTSVESKNLGTVGDHSILCKHTL